MTPSSNSKALRTLGGFEQMFAAYGAIQAMVFSTVASISGVVSERQLKEAAAQVARSHPLLRASLGLDADGVAAFVATAETVPVAMTEASLLSWERLTERCLGGRIDTSCGPLWRVDAQTDGSATDLVLTFHHTIADGISGVAVLKDMLTALAGGVSEMSAMPGSSDVLLGLPAPRFTFGANSETDDDVEPPTIRSLNYEADDASVLFDTCRRHGVTVNSMLAVAFARSHFKGPTPAAPIFRLMSPINLKPIVNPTDDVSLCISIALTSFENDESDFWTAAASFGTGMGKWKSPEMARGVHSGIAARLTDDATLAVAKRRLVESIPFDGVISNLGIIDIPERYGSLVLEKMWAPALRSIPGQDTVGVSTFGGALRLVHTTVGGDVSLLGRIEHLLRVLV